MKLQASMILLGCDAMKHMDGKLDQFAIHIGGGAFDAGTSETLAKWAIRKCEKKVCSVWPWAQCPLHTTKFDKDKKLTQAPCCHKCWNKCPPYLARHKLNDRSAFANSEKRRAIKEQIWEFLEDDIQCEKTKLKDEFMNPSEAGLSLAQIIGDDSESILDDDCEEGDEECENDFGRYNLVNNGAWMANDEGLDKKGATEAEETKGGVDVRETLDERTARLSTMTSKQIAAAHMTECYTYAPHSDFDCHGHRGAKCCSNSCLNQGTNAKDACDKCGCNGVCGYLHNTYAQLAKDPYHCYELDHDKQTRRAALKGDPEKLAISFPKEE